MIAAGFGCGFINTLAGSGSLISLPLLIFLGLPANVANGTNRVAILLQTVVAVDRFRRDKAVDLRRGLLLALPAIAGAVLGAQIAVNLNEDAMETVIGVLMVVMLGVVIVRPRRWLTGRPEMLGRRPGWLQVAVLFLIGIYGGFIQAGVGIFLLAGLVLVSGYELVGANAVKNLIVLAFTAFALVVFIINGQVAWLPGLVLAVGNMLGAWVAARLAVRRGATFVRWILIAVIVVSAVVLLDLLAAVRGLFG
ncbi:MAG TPA: sulfite exporter TauE/SafE family protein [Verrucomicrobiota bacterium]|nr:sulfite exporter TauE/SafE family protein [Verrucomicrobiota bacterium]